MLLFDVKGMHSEAAYRAASRSETQSGAVERREHEVGREYVSHARAILVLSTGQSTGSILLLS